MSEKTALVLIFDGVEELEAIAPVNFMRRAGVAVTVAAHGENLEVTGRNGIHIRADALLKDVQCASYDCLVTPGGPGCLPLAEDGNVLGIIKKQAQSGGLVAAICAAPTILNAAGVLTGKAHTAHFSVNDRLPDMLPDAAVVQDGNVVTSQGAGAATEFGLTLVARLLGEDKAQEVARSICYRSELSQP